MDTIKSQDIGTRGHRDSGADSPDIIVLENAIDAQFDDAVSATPSKEYDCAVCALYAKRNHGTDLDRFLECELNLNEIRSGNLWLDIDTLPAADISLTEHIWMPVRVVGVIETLEDPIPVSGDESDYSAQIIRIRGIDGTNLDTLAIDRELFNGGVDISHLFRKQKSAIFCGAMIPAWSNTKSYFRFYLKAIQTKVKPSDLSPIKLSNRRAPGFAVKLPDGRTVGIPENHPYLLIEKLRGGNRIIKHIKERVVEQFGIVGLEKSPELDKAIEFIILQSFSFGLGHDRHSMRLHDLVIGPAGKGKSFLTHIALYLNTRCEKISGVSAKVTPAGLIGRVQTRNGKPLSSGGLLPRNNNGTVCIQDFHAVEGRTRQQVCSIFSEMMEDGEVTDSTSAGVTLEAEVALHLDMNRLSQVRPNESFDSFTDINIPINILSRFDFILEIPRDVEQQTDVGKKILGSIGQSFNSRSPETVEELRNLVTFMKDVYSFVEPLTETTQQYLYKRYIETWQLFETRIDQKLREDFQARTARSLLKLVKAITCCNGRTWVTNEDIDYALRFIEAKLGFLSSIKPDDIQVDMANLSEEDYRRSLIAREFSGRETSTNEIVETLLKKYPDIDISEKMIQRDLQTIGARWNRSRRKWFLEVIH